MLIPVDRNVFLPLLLWSFAAGIFFGAVYDIFRIRRAAFRIPGLDGKKAKSRLMRFFIANLSATDTVIVFIEDIIFSLFCTSAFILINFKLYFGLPRWYSVVSAAGGFFLYHYTVGRLVIMTAEAIVRFIASVIRFVISHTVIPLCAFVKKIIALLSEAERKRRLLLYTAMYEKRLIFSVSDIYIPSQNNAPEDSHVNISGE